MIIEKLILILKSFKNYGLFKCKRACAICTDRREYLYDLKKHHGEVEDCVIFGFSSIAGRALLFHAIMENGAVLSSPHFVPLFKGGFKPSDVPNRRLDELQLWNCFSYYPAVTSWDILDSTVR